MTLNNFCSEKQQLWRVQKAAAFIEGDKMLRFRFTKLGIKLTFTVTCMLKKPSPPERQQLYMHSHRLHVLDAPFTYPVGASAFLRFCLTSTRERI